MEVDFNGIRQDIAEEWAELTRKLNKSIKKHGNDYDVDEGTIVVNAEYIYPQMQSLQQLIMVLCGLQAEEAGIRSVIDEVAFTRFNPEEL